MSRGEGATIFKIGCVKGNATVEYILILPVAFACIFAVINLFLALHQQSLLQNLAESAAESLSRQWNYIDINEIELKNGVYLTESFDDREIYWNLKVWENSAKEEKAKTIIGRDVEDLSLLKAYEVNQASLNKALQGLSRKPILLVNYQMGFPSTVTVHIRSAYKLPGLSIMEVLGLGDAIVLEAKAEAAVYDAKDMINTTDYVVQMLRGTRAYDEFQKAIEPLKGTLDKILSH